MDLERDVANFLSTESSILYSQRIFDKPRVIDVFARRGDIIVPDPGINFAVLKGLQISHRKVRCFDRNGPKGMEDVLLSDERKTATPWTSNETIHPYLRHL